MRQDIKRAVFLGFQEWFDVDGGFHTTTGVASVLYRSYLRRAMSVRGKIVGKILGGI